ncbi:hypothetical protein GGQ15_003129 [Salinibacter ruber]|nr:hypothetical protein [Salinibacter ruber]
MGKTTLPNAPSETGSDMSPEAKRHEAPPVRANAEKLLRGVFKVADPYFEPPCRSYRAIIVLSERERAVKLPDLSGRYEPVGSGTLSSALTEQISCPTMQSDVIPITKGDTICF